MKALCRCCCPRCPRSKKSICGWKWWFIAVPAYLKSGQSTKGAGTWSGRPAGVLLWVYFARRHNFSLCASSLWEFILFFLLLSLLLGDGSAGRRCLQRLWPQWVFCRLLPCHWMPCLRAASSSAPCLATWCKFYLALQVSLPILLGKVLSCPGPTASAPQVPPQYQTRVSGYVFILSKAVRHRRLL